MRLKDKVVFISGAGSGMGRLASQWFAREGAQIVANDYNAQALDESVAMVRAEGGQAIAVAGDVSKQADVEQRTHERTLATHECDTRRHARIETAALHHSQLPDCANAQGIRAAFRKREIQDC